MTPYNGHQVPALGQFGLTLLEIMITIFILSLGLLGLAGLQMTGLKSNRNALYQTLSAQLVGSISEQIQSDPVGANGTAYDNLVQDGDKSQCAVANPDLKKISACIASSLPSGTARVTKRTDNPKTFYVAVIWADVQLGTNVGWGVDNTNATPPSYATTACGTPVAGMSCYYAVSSVPPV